jgi:FeS assembly protein IscX
MDNSPDSPLSWEASYAVARALQAQHTGIDLEDVSLDMIRDWTLALPDFDDDPSLANDEILLDIYNEWLEQNFSGDA